MQKILKVGEKVQAVVAFKDVDGNVASVDGMPVWAVDTANVAMEVAADGMSAMFTAMSVGASKIQVSADADLGPDVKTIIGEGDIMVVAKEAVTVEISFGDVA